MQVIFNKGHPSHSATAAVLQDARIDGNIKSRMRSETSSSDYIISACVRFLTTTCTTTFGY